MNAIHVLTRAAWGLGQPGLLAASLFRTDWTRGHERNELRPEAVTVPPRILRGERDPRSPCAAQAALFEGPGNPHKTWSAVPGGDHAFLETPRPYLLAAVRAFLPGDGPG